MVFLLRHTSYYYYEHGSIITVSNTKPFSKHMPLLHSHHDESIVPSIHIYYMYAYNIIVIVVYKNINEN